MPSTSKWSLRVTGPVNTPSPIFTGNLSRTVSGIINYFQSLKKGTAGGSFTVATAKDQVAASAQVALVAATGTTTATINGVDCSDTANANNNKTVDLLVTAVNTTATSDLVTKAAVASRGLSKAYGYFTCTSVTPGACSPEVPAGNAVTFTATGVDADDAKLLAAAINANDTAAQKVFAWATGASGVTYISARDGAVWNLTVTGTNGTARCNINGVGVSAAFDTSTTVTAAALATAINASEPLTRLGFHATSSTNVVHLLSAGTNLKPIRVSGTGTTVAGDVITLSSSSGTITATINGYTASVTYATSDTVTALALAGAINALPAGAGVGNATNSAGVVTVVRSSTADDSYSVLGGSGSGDMAVAVAVPTNGGAGLLYGGTLGNAITLTTSGNCVRSGANLTTGVSALVLKSRVAGYAGNWITLASTAGGGTATSSSAKFIGGTETQGTFTFPAGAAP